jgi:hypothetical protein
MKFFSSFFKASEKRTQFFTITGFIILPVLAMIYVFIYVVMDDERNAHGQRLKIPPQMLESMREKP